MNYKIMIRIHSWILLLASAFMAPALLISIVTSDRPAERGFAGAILITLAAAATRCRETHTKATQQQSFPLPCAAQKMQSCLSAMK